MRTALALALIVGCYGGDMPNHSDATGAELHVPLGVSPDDLDLPANTASALVWTDGAGNEVLNVSTITAGQTVTIGNTSMGKLAVSGSATTLTSGLRINDDQGGNVSTSPTTLTALDCKVTVDSSGGAITLNLPAVANVNGMVLFIKDIGNAATNNITIDGNSAETIDGSATYTMTQNYEAITIVADSAAGGWWIM